MSAIEYVQTAASLVGVVVGGGIWFKLGNLTALFSSLNVRVERLENYTFFKKE